MRSDWISRIDSLIKWSFYALFFFVPLVMFPATYELFEFNKMWFVFGISILIFFLWASKMIISGQIEIRRTPLDIPIALFLASQIISTIVSIEPHVSLWGYYSRFNGGLFSMIAYIFLYYAFATNLTKSDSKAPVSYKILFVSLISGLIVTLWGLPSHFGYDPTCFLFRGTLDVSCWGESFKPTIRIFSTLGQPNWLGTFLAVLIPIGIGFGLSNLPESNINIKDIKKAYMIPALFLGLLFLYYLALLYTRSQSSFLGLALGILVSFLLLFFFKFRKYSAAGLIRDKFLRYVLAATLLFAITTFLIGSPIPTLNKYTTAQGLMTALTKKPQEALRETKEKSKQSPAKQAETGGTESSKIRLIVWRGALELFSRNPLFGTGVETFAFAYYKVKPIEHNLTSEWDYLYNKAHNEYLNYLATTGAFGLGSYLFLIAFFYYYCLKTLSRHKHSAFSPISIAILGSFTAILVSSFFGFSVVILNLFLFFLPLFFFELTNREALSKSFTYPNKKEKSREQEINIFKMAGIFIVAAVALFYEFYLLNFWLADKKYALGYNLNKAGEFTQAFTPLSEAVKMLPSEDLYKDELSINMATLAVLLSQQNQGSEAAKFANQAKSLSDEVVSRHRGNVVFYKTRTRVLFALSQLDPSYLDSALDSIKKAQVLAPTDPKIIYNMALFYNQKGETAKTIELLNQAKKMKNNYVDAYYALGLFYSQLAREDPGNAAVLRKLAKENLNFILTNINSDNDAAKQLLKTLE
ncbi:MAG: hypothetical protein A3G66_04425 [Candidatus Levybacteria bacterium RIFCSPLOWO2_12_FULL_39_17]|uniref:O-antigen ligase-related domain-containing protein n=1 Tax=Candidatus Woesebacteria bacterium GW2011_GWA1_43_12 TaxID=1618557 RepID=A0A0G1CW76_9BACT|nr:MAG: hypothetical protein UV66_C0010G0003 [Candidatus Woesebacteria bacterium GW2011_GWA1_43_12]OGH45131.1 MAG: hypothetical protein A3H82_02385 [Candidatus Levybacteria bacterium RIFCSPLOWO2_02_FULL_39_26]OGH46993.1 MAG: hypothetical protein A3G66_04425 [Candidatus Levybacteria bacterium RIFCSPLOWO2_12_FULL_39_17]